MLSSVKDWWRTRQAIKIGNAEVERFNNELSDCRRILVSVADESVQKLNDELSALKSDPDFDLDLCREIWRDWHDEGEELVEISRGAVHQRMNEFSDFAEVVGIESEMTAVIDKAVDECKAYFLLGGADAYMKFATVENLVPDEE